MAEKWIIVDLERTFKGFIEAWKKFFVNTIVLVSFQ